MLITFWDFVTVEQIFLSPQVKWGMIISSKLVYIYELPNKSYEY